MTPPSSSPIDSSIDTFYLKLLGLKQELEILTKESSEMLDAFEWKERLSITSQSDGVNEELERLLEDARDLVSRADSELSGCNVVSQTSLLKLNKNQEIKKKEDNEKAELSYSSIPPVINSVDIHSLDHLKTVLNDKGCDIPFPSGVGKPRGKIADILEERYGKSRNPVFDIFKCPLLRYLGTNILRVNNPKEGSEAFYSAASSYTSSIQSEIVDESLKRLETDNVSNKELRLYDAVLNDGFPRVLVKR